MKSFSITLVFLLLVTLMLTGCAPGTNQSKGAPNSQNVVATFWLGIWQGFIAPFVFVVSLFKSNLNIYEVHNNGSWYNLGYLLGLACFFGGGGNRAARRK
jgi:polyferredoxin